MHNDYLAIAGDTWDSALLGITGGFPFIALASVSIGGKYYWAKALSLKNSVTIYGV